MKKLNNKGFSLVELIIVIAIMAILVGVVGTQVIPYLERSRQGKDMQIFSGWNTAGMSAYSMTTDKVDASKDLTFELQYTASTGVWAISVSNGTANTDAVKATFCELIGAKDNKITSKLVSKAGAGVTKVDITIDADDKTVTTTIDGDADAEAAFPPIENK